MWKVKSLAVCLCVLTKVVKTNSCYNFILTLLVWDILVFKLGKVLSCNVEYFNTTFVLTRSKLMMIACVCYSTRLSEDVLINDKCDYQ